MPLLAPVMTTTLSATASTVHRFSTGMGPNDVRLFAGRSEHIPNKRIVCVVFGPRSNVRVPFTDHVATRANANGSRIASGLAVTVPRLGDVGLFEVTRRPSRAPCSTSSRECCCYITSSAISWTASVAGRSTTADQPHPPANDPIQARDGRQRRLGFCRQPLGSHC